MAVKSSLLPPDLIPSFSHSASLYVPDIPRTVPILDSTSYSPFPTFPGTARATDPYGLNTFLLAPGDALWNYVDPLPDCNASGSGSGSESDKAKSMLGLNKAMPKQKSLGVLRPSPLSQPPIFGDEAKEFEKPLIRKRSLSIGTISPTLPKQEEQSDLLTNIKAAVEVVPIVKKEQGRRKSLKKAFTLGRRGRKSESALSLSSIPPVPTLSFTDEDPSASPPSTLTPLSTRSSSQTTLSSSASSISSSEGIKTPAEGQPETEVFIEGKILANALEKGRKNRIWGWLGGRKKGDGLSMFSKNSSAKSSPNSSTVDLLAISQASPPQTQVKSAVFSPAQMLLQQAPIEHTFLTNQLRTSSMKKLSQLRAPSPHPFALSLARQSNKLPDEIALSIQSGRRVFPKSVNIYTGLADLSPAQGGLRLGLAVRDVMIKLDRGEKPYGTISPRRNFKKALVPRPRGVLDFINRPPFEHRNHVLCSDGIYTHVTMARPGHVMWAFEYSPYITSLCEVDEISNSDGRPSQESFDSLKKAAQDVETKDALDEQEAGEKETQDADAALRALEGNVKLSPPLMIKTIESDATKIALTVATSYNTTTAAIRRSSFVRPPVPTRRTSYDSENVDDDDMPLSVTKSRSQLSRPNQSPLASLEHPRVRASSQPNTRDRSSKRFSQIMLSPEHLQMEQQAALVAIQQARERREQNSKGANEKRAEAEMQKEKMRDRKYRGVSMIDLKTVPDLVQKEKYKRMSSGSRLDLAMSSGHARFPSPSKVIPKHENNRNSVMSTMSTFQTFYQPSFTRRPENVRSRTSVDHEKTSSRYHSFYEQRGGVSSTTSLHKYAAFPTQMAQPLQQIYMQGMKADASGMQGMLAIQQNRGSMMFNLDMNPQQQGHSLGLSPEPMNRRISRMS
ncbi:hypothetical protein L204_105399 [Cryptococcus depauperatus]|nr:hypothetical protein L204_02830 [Cryptococcus depauperatus CBS 7855]